jgi:trehalose synthase
MTSLVVERLDMPGSTRAARSFGAARARVGDVLAGRTVSCAAAAPAGRTAARELRRRLQSTGSAAAAPPCTVADARGDLARLTNAVSDILSAVAPTRPRQGRTSERIYTDAARACEDLLGDQLRADDVVVAHDTPSALLAEAAREHGAHAVWRVPAGTAAGRSRSQELESLRRFIACIDAYLLTWRERGPGGEMVDCVAAAMPSAGIVAAKKFPAPLADPEPGGQTSEQEARQLAWWMVVAEIVRTDRGEAVGGTLHPRPSVAPR